MLLESVEPLIKTSQIGIKNDQLIRYRTWKSNKLAVLLLTKSQLLVVGLEVWQRRSRYENKALMPMSMNERRNFAQWERVWLYFRTA